MRSAPKAMEFNQISNFIPFYPDLTDPNFSYNIARKKEFNDYALTSDYTQIPGLFRQQVIIQRFLSPETLYNELLIYHRVGAGKTATALAVGEAWKIQARETNVCENRQEGERNLLTQRLKTPSQCPLIIVRNVDRFKIIFEQELEDRFPQYSSPDATFKKNYQIESYVTARKQDVHNYSNRVIIIDEAHNLQPQPDQNKEKENKQKENYQILLGKLQRGVNSKKILLTGTPIPDHASQIVPLMNLILPTPLPDEALTRFDKIYFNKAGVFEPGDLTQVFAGRVSYFRSIIPSILQVNQGKIVKIIDDSLLEEKIIEIGTTVPVVPNVMSKFQYDKTNETFKKDPFSQTARRNATMVFPGLEWKLQNQPSNEIMKQSIFSMGDSKDSPPLEVLKEYSATFYSILQDIQKHPDNLFFIYLDYVNGLGSQINFGYVLERFLKYDEWGKGGAKRPRRPGAEGGKKYAILGFQRKFTKGESFLKDIQQSTFSQASERDPSKSKRIESAPATEKRSRKILEKFNSDSNINGANIHVLIGGRKSGEGITIKNVTRVHLIPYWNFTKGQQAIGRTIRPTSHNALIKKIIQDRLSTSNLDYEHVRFDDLLGLTRKFTLAFPPNEKNYTDQVNAIDGFRVERREGHTIVAVWTDTIKVNVFHHVAVGPPLPSEPDLFRITKDVHVFDIATQKYKKTSQVLQFLKQISFDCPLTYPKNIAGGEENYQCLGFPEEAIEMKQGSVWDYSIPPNHIQYDTYDLFYTNRDEIVKKVALLFTERSIMSFQQILKKIKERPNPLLGALQSVISRNYPLKNRFGFRCCLREDRDMYFLVDLRDSFRDDQKYEHAIYSAFPFVTFQTSLQTLNDFHLLKQQESSTSPGAKRPQRGYGSPRSGVRQFCESPTEEEAFLKLSLQIRVRLLEEIYQNGLVEDLPSFINESVKKNIYVMEDGVAVHVMFPEFHTDVGSGYRIKHKYTGEMRVLGENGVWRYAFPEEEKKYIPEIIAQITTIQDEYEGISDEESEEEREKSEKSKKSEDEYEGISDEKSEVPSLSPPSEAELSSVSFDEEEDDPERRDLAGVEERLIESGPEEDSSEDNEELDYPSSDSDPSDY